MTKETNQLQIDPNPATISPEDGQESGGPSLLILAHAERGCTIYVQGGFYYCIDRLRFGGNGCDDIFQLSLKYPFAPETSSWYITSGGDLDDLEHEGRAALVQRPAAQVPEPRAAPRRPHLTGAALALTD